MSDIEESVKSSEKKAEGKTIGARFRSLPRLVRHKFATYKYKIAQTNDEFGAEGTYRTNSDDLWTDIILPSENTSLIYSDQTTSYSTTKSTFQTEVDTIGDGIRSNAHHFSKFKIHKIFNDCYPSQIPTANNSKKTNTMCYKTLHTKSADESTCSSEPNTSTIVSALHRICVHKFLKFFEDLHHKLANSRSIFMAELQYMQLIPSEIQQDQFKPIALSEDEYCKLADPNYEPERSQQEQILELYDLVDALVNERDEQLNSHIAKLREEIRVFNKVLKQAEVKITGIQVAESAAGFEKELVEKGQMISMPDCLSIEQLNDSVAVENVFKSALAFECDIGNWKGKFQECIDIPQILDKITGMEKSVVAIEKNLAETREQNFIRDRKVIEELQTLSELVNMVDSNFKNMLKAIKVDKGAQEKSEQKCTDKKSTKKEIFGVKVKGTKREQFPPSNALQEATEVADQDQIEKGELMEQLEDLEEIVHYLNLRLNRTENKNKGKKHSKKLRKLQAKLEKAKNELQERDTNAKANIDAGVLLENLRMETRALEMRIIKHELDRRPIKLEPDQEEDQSGKAECNIA